MRLGPRTSCFLLLLSLAGPPGDRSCVHTHNLAPAVYKPLSYAFFFSFTAKSIKMNTKSKSHVGVRPEEQGPPPPPLTPPAPVWGMGGVPRRSPLSATRRLLALLLGAGRQGPGSAPGSPRGGAAGTRGYGAAGTGSGSRRRPAHLPAPAPGRPIRARLGRARRPIRGGGSGAGSRRARSEPREPGAGGGAAARGRAAGAAGPAEDRSPGRPGCSPAAALRTVQAVSQVTAPALRASGRACPAGGAPQVERAGAGAGAGRRGVLAPRVPPLAPRAPTPPRVPRSEPGGGGGATFPPAAGVQGREGVK